MGGVNLGIFNRSKDMGGRAGERNVSKHWGGGGGG